MDEIPIHVSCHAVRRYAERRLGIVVQAESDTAAMNVLALKGVDLPGIRATLRRLGEKARAYGAQAIITGNLKVIVVQSVVVTVAPKAGVY